MTLTCAICRAVLVLNRGAWFKAAVEHRRQNKSGVKVVTESIDDPCS